MSIPIFHAGSSDSDRVDLRRSDEALPGPNCKSIAYWVKLRAYGGILKMCIESLFPDSTVSVEFGMYSALDRSLNKKCDLMMQIVQENKVDSFFMWTLNLFMLRESRI